MAAMPSGLDPFPIATDALESTRQTSFLDGADRGATIMLAVLAFVAATRGTAFAEKIILRSTEMSCASEAASIVTKHAAKPPTVDSLQACATELVTWAERGN